ncbi:uncharacterized protein LOC144357878 [Saccoglossus kowalevskii]
MDNIWRSNMSRSFKTQFFRATAESILLYGAETWTLTKAMEKDLDGTYTYLLRHAQNISWRQNVTNKDRYGNLPKVSKTIRKRRLRLVGHCFRHNEPASLVLL